MTAAKPIQWNERWQTALDTLCARVRKIKAATGQAWPYHCPSGNEWDTTEDGDWCGGHWVECLRIVGELEGDSELLEESERRTNRLQPYLERDDMFRGHRFYYSAARQYAWTRNPKYRTVALAAAYAVRSMAMDATGLMPIGTQVQVRSTPLSGRDKVCIDNVHPNLMLDWWAYKQTGDQSFIEGARRHLDATEKYFIQADGSTIEFADFDPVSGEMLRHYTLLGAHDDSCWSRGHAWAVAGYLRAYEELDDLRYLAIARRLFDYWIDNTDSTLVPPWDFKDPRLQTEPATVVRDSSAAAIVVEQLARLAIKPALDHVARHMVDQHLAPMIDGLLQLLVPPEGKGGRSAGVLLEGCFNYPKSYAVDTELIWGTAYLLYAMYYLKTGRVVE